MNLVEHSLWWLVPYTVLMLVMLHAMMEFTVSLLTQRPRDRRKPISAAELRRRLLAVNEPGQDSTVQEGRDCDLEIYWQRNAAPPAGRFTIARGSSLWHLRFLLDERRHELRVNVVARSSFFFLGFAGWLPRFGGYFSAQSGPPGAALPREIGQVTTRNGWSVRPVLWWFQATRRGYDRLQWLTPARVRRWPAQRFWGALYPLSYALGMGYLVLAIGPLDRQDLLLFVVISAIWWGTWGFLIWMLLEFPSFWRRWRG